MERMTIITITEMERLALRESVTRTFRETGDPMLYLFPPCIVLGKGSDIKKRIELPERFNLSGRTGRNAWGSFMEFRESGMIGGMQDALGLERIPTGLHVSYDPATDHLVTDVKSVRAFALALAEWDGHSFRIIQQKRLQ